MDYSAYFAHAERVARTLEAHGLPCNPTDEDILGFAIEQADRIDALCTALGVEIVTDYRDRCRVIRAEAV